MRIQGWRKIFWGVSKCCKIVLHETAVDPRLRVIIQLSRIGNVLRNI